ncbi:MAG: DUF697 domain-containing protein [Planctomycetota bacterium]
MTDTSDRDDQRFGVPASAVVDSRPVDPARPPEFIEPVFEDDAPLDLELDGSVQRERGRSLLDPSTWVGGRVALALSGVLCGAAVLLVVSQGVALLADVQALATPWREAVLVVAGLAGLAIVFGAARLAFALIRFGTSPRLSAKAIDELRTRRELRADAHRDLEAAAGTLRGLLAKTDPPGPGVLGVREADAESLALARRALLDDPWREDPGGWVARYRDEYGSVVDSAAKRLIRRRATMVAAKTAVLPGGALDTVVVLSHAYMLTADLCKLYRLRADRVGTAMILWRVLLGTFIAGRIEDLTDEAARQLTGALRDAAAGTVAKVSAGVAGKVAGKAAEGAVNGVLTYRLGLAVMRQVRPID